MDRYWQPIAREVELECGSGSVCDFRREQATVIHLLDDERRFTSCSRRRLIPATSEWSCRRRCWDECDNSHLLVFRIEIGQQLVGELDAPTVCRALDYGGVEYDRLPLSKTQKMTVQGYLSARSKTWGICIYIVVTHFCLASYKFAETQICTVWPS
jgi:hypothetical protein